jgi:hypothetical protein
MGPTKEGPNDEGDKQNAYQYKTYGLLLGFRLQFLQITINFCVDDLL